MYAFRILVISFAFLSSLLSADPLEKFNVTDNKGNSYILVLDSFGNGYRGGTATTHQWHLYTSDTEQWIRSFNQHSSINEDCTAFQGTSMDGRRIYAYTITENLISNCYDEPSIPRNF